jgi:hypothetical protein
MADFVNFELTPAEACKSASGPYLSSDRRLLAKLVPTFADRVCHVVSAANPHDRNFDLNLSIPLNNY